MTLPGLGVSLCVLERGGVSLPFGAGMFRWMFQLSALHGPMYTILLDCLMLNNLTNSMEEQRRQELQYKATGPSRTIGKSLARWLSRSSLAARHERVWECL